MGLADNFQCVNRIPNQGQPWTLEDAQRCWNMFIIDGASLTDIGKAMGRTKKAILSFVCNLMLYPDREPGPQLTMIDRTEHKWTQRDSWVVEQFNLHKKLTFEDTGRLIGRTHL